MCKRMGLLLMSGLLLAGMNFAVLADGLVQVKQTIFGMDCAPCAYGVQKGLQKLPGVQHVTVSLKDGQAVVELAPDNAVTLAEIQAVIRHGGFTPKQATLRVSGEVTEKDGRFQLQVGGKPEYELVFSGTKPPAELDAGQHIIVEGMVAAISSGSVQKLTVLNLSR